MRGLRSLKRYFRDAAHGVFRNFSLSLASISCITITLIVVAVSLVLSMNVQNFSDSIRKDVTVVMFLKGDTTKEDETKILNELKSKLVSELQPLNIPNIFITLSVLKLDKSKVVRLEHP